MGTGSQHTQRTERRFLPLTLLFFFSAGSTSALLDLSGLDLPATGPSYPAVPTLSGGSAAPVPDQAGSVSLLDDELMSLGEEAAAKALFYVLEPGDSEQLALLGAEA